MYPDTPQTVWTDGACANNQDDRFRRAGSGNMQRKAPMDGATHGATLGILAWLPDFRTHEKTRPQKMSTRTQDQRLRSESRIWLATCTSGQTKAVTSTPVVRSCEAAPITTQWEALGTFLSQDAADGARKRHQEEILAYTTRCCFNQTRWTAVPQLDFDVW